MFCFRLTMQKYGIRSAIRLSKTEQKWSISVYIQKEIINGMKKNTEGRAIMSTFADMEGIKFDYADRNIRLLTVFDEIAKVDTTTLDGYLILACDGGKMNVDVNGTKKYLEAGEALILPPHTKLGNYMVSPGIRCDLAVIATERVKQMLKNHIEDWERCIYINQTNHIVTDEADRKQFAHYAGLLSFKMQQQNRRYNKEVMESVLQSILFDYLEIMMNGIPQTAPSSPDGQRKILFKHFLELLATRQVKHQLVDTYAQELCVSPNYLTKVCREVTGKTALQWIREYTEQDIRFYLIHSEMTIKQICDHLGFPNLSFFGKYCRRAFGCSPTEFRKRPTE